MTKIHFYGAYAKTVGVIDCALNFDPDRRRKTPIAVGIVRILSKTVLSDTTLKRTTGDIRPSQRQPWRIPYVAIVWNHRRRPPHIDRGSLPVPLSFESIQLPQLQSFIVRSAAYLNTEVPAHQTARNRKPVVDS